MSDLTPELDAIRAVLGPRPRPLPDSAPVYMKRDNEKHIAAWDALERLSDPDYSPAYQDEYQRLWHEASSRAERAEARVKRLEEALRAIQAVAVTSQNHHAEPHRLDWLREIEGRARAALEEGAE